MMMDNSSQEIFINKLISAKCPCHVFLINGIRLVGIVKAQDAASITIEGKDSTDQLVFKQAVSTIAPA